LIADREGGTGVFVDSGAPLAPLHEAVERLGLMVTHLLTTHADADHIAGDDELRERYGLEIVKGPLQTGGLSFDALATPGHKDDHLTFVCNGQLAFTGDVLFKDAVGGGNLAEVRASVVDVLRKLPPETRDLPGHTAETTRDRGSAVRAVWRDRGDFVPRRSARFRPRRRRRGRSRTSAAS